MILHEVSHVDHVPREILEWVLHQFHDKSVPFIETVEIPLGFPWIDCGLHGPIMGDVPIPEEEVTYQVRPGRGWPSRLIQRPTRPTRQLVVIGGPYQEHSCILYTCFGGVLAPKEPQDPTLDPDKLAESQAFWAVHALSIVR